MTALVAIGAIALLALFLASPGAGAIAAIMVLLLAMLLKLRDHSRPCPRCGGRVGAGVLECPSCGFDFSGLE